MSNQFYLAVTAAILFGFWGGYMFGFGRSKIMAAENILLDEEIDRLGEELEKAWRRNGVLDQNVQALSETHILYTWLRKKCDQPSNDQVAVQMNIGHDWVPVHDLDRDLRTMIDREEP
jgi:hypothetical protein